MIWKVIDKQGVSPPMTCSFNEIKGERKRKRDTIMINIGNSFLCKVKLGKRELKVSIS